MIGLQQTNMVRQGIMNATLRDHPRSITTITITPEQFIAISSRGMPTASEHTAASTSKDIFIDNANTKPQIICIQETWFNEIIATSQYPGYNIESQDAEKQGRGGGVAIIHTIRGGMHIVDVYRAGDQEGVEGISIHSNTY